MTDFGLNWIGSYFTKRTQYIDCYRLSSSIKERETDVPQAFTLGPLLFMVYMNDIYIYIQSVMILIFHMLMMSTDNKLTG